MKNLKKLKENNAKSESKDVVITLKRGACYGPCPIYSLAIYGDGKVVYKGERFVGITGKRVSKISQEKVKKLIKAFYKINYFSLKDEYSLGPTDCSSAETSITIDGKTKTVYHYYGDETAPKELTRLEDKIDKIVGTERWIKLFDE